MLNHRKPRLAPKIDPGENRELAGAFDIGNQQILGEDSVARHIGHNGIGHGRDHHRANGQAIQAVREIDGIGRAHDHQHRKEDVEGAEIRSEALKKGTLSLVEYAGRKYNTPLMASATATCASELLQCRQSLVLAAGIFKIVIQETDCAETLPWRPPRATHRDSQIGPQQRRHHHGEEYQDAAHRGVPPFTWWWLGPSSRIFCPIP